MLTATIPLTDAQRQFAERQAALPALVRPDGVFMYAETPVSTLRWLVNADGKVLESASFRRGW